MNDLPLIQAVKEANREQLVSLLDSGHDIQERGEQEWPALNFAAGKGDLETVRLLIQRGANVFATGTDRRTPYKIAIAASHLEVARELARAEEAVGGDREKVSSREWENRPYCKAHRLGDLRRYPQWGKSLAPGVKGDDLRDDEFVFIHDDYSVTRSIWRDQGLLIQGHMPEWREFCEGTLQFKAPTDLDDLCKDSISSAK